MLVIGLILRVQISGAGPYANAALMIALAAPAVLTMHWAGRVADRLDSRKILLAAVTLQLVACLVLATPWTAHPGWLMYCACLAFQVGYSFATPVWMALIPRIVGEDGVQGLAAAQMLIASFTAPLGAALSGVLVGAFGTQLVPLVAVTLLVPVGVMMRAIKTRRQVQAEQTDSTSTPGGLGFIFRDRVLAVVLIGTVVALLVIQGVNVVEVFLVRDDLGATPAQYGFTEVFVAIGTAAAAVAVTRLTNDTRRAAAITIGFATCALVCVAISQVGSFGAYLVMATIIGAGNALANGALGPLFLLRTLETHRGAVIAAFTGVTSAASIIALLVGGLIGAWLGPRDTFLAGGLMAIPVILIMGLLAIPAARTLAQPTPPATSAQAFTG